MKTKSFIFLIVLIFTIVFSLSAVCADDLQTADSGQVSGDVVVVSENPYTTSGELTYDIPADAKDIRSADVYVNVYSGSAKNTYGANANVSLKTQNGENQIASEELWIENGTTDGTVYPVNDHVDKCYSDYQMRYDITDSLKGLNGTSISIKVDTFEMTNKSFDGRIKLIALVLAYDDGDADEINYWIDSAQRWTKTNVTISFDTAGVTDIAKADLTDIVLSSANGNFTLNGELLGEPDNHTAGSTYQYNYWNVTDKIVEGKNTEIMGEYAGTSAYGSLKNVLTVLKIQSITANVDISLATEYPNTCYAGTNNTLTVKVKANKAGKYMVELDSSDGPCETVEVELDGENETTLLLTDPTIRPIDETTVNGANNTEVKYTVDVLFNGTVVGKANKTVPVLYNGYLGKDLEYNATYIENINSYTVNSYMIIPDSYYPDISYMSSNDTNKTVVWDLSDSYYREHIFVKMFLYIPYNWDKSGVDGPVFNTTFNGNEIAPKFKYRDQSNLGEYGSYGYGLYVYDVTDLVQKDNNTFVLNKEPGLTAVYPTYLFELYNFTDSSMIMDITLLEGVDLISNDYNDAGRIVKTDSQVEVSKGEHSSLVIFAAGAEEDDYNVIINGEAYPQEWNGTSESLSHFSAEVPAGLNNVSVVATGSPFLLLNQFLVVEHLIHQTRPEIVIDVPNDIKFGDNVTVTIRIENATGEIFVKADEVSFEIPLDSGSASIIMNNITAGIHGVAVYYPGDDFYLSDFGFEFFEVDGLPAPIPTEITDIVVNEDLNISLVLKDQFGRPVANAYIVYVINGTIKRTVTAADGSFVIAAINGIAINVGYFGNETLLPASAMITVNVPVVPTVVKVESQFNITGGVITLNGYAVDTKAGEEGMYYATELLDADGNPIKGAKIQFAVNDKIYNRTTNENGSFNPYKLNMVRGAGRYTMAFYFAGNDNYTGAFASVCVDLDKKPIKIKAGDKSYKVSATKKYTVTLSTEVCSSHDGNVYLSPRTVTLTVNGKTYTGKTNSAGKVTFKITNLSKKAKYKARISYEGDATYESAIKTVTLTVK